MYERILVAIDATPTEENRSALTRTEQIGRLTGATVYVLHVARAHIVAGRHHRRLGASACCPRRTMSRRRTGKPCSSSVDSLAAAGIEAHGEMRERDGA